MEWKTIDINSYSENEYYLEERNCPVCNDENHKPLLEYKNFQFFTDDTDLSKQTDIQTVQCKNCGTVFMNPCYSMKGFEVLFSEAGMSYGSTAARPFEQVDWLKDRGLLKTGLCVFDIGCGTGEFLNSLPNNLHRVGIDIDEVSIEKGRSNYKDIEFICSAFDSLEYDKNIDVITMYHVLEHLPNPKETLKRLHKISNEKTRLIVEVPIIENGLTNDINGFFTVQHLTHFSRLSLKNILRLSGWEIIEWYEQDDYNGCRVLVEKGTEKLEIEDSKNELINIYKYFSTWYKSLYDVEEKILNLKKEKYVIWGGGMHTEYLYQTTSLFKKNRKFIIIDIDEKKQNKYWRGIKIYSPSILEELKDDVSIVISSYGSQNKIDEHIKNVKPNANTIKLYDYLKVY